MASGFPLQCWLHAIFFPSSRSGAKSLYNTVGLCATGCEESGVLLPKGSLARAAQRSAGSGRAPDLEELLATCKYCCVAATRACLSAELKEFGRIRASVCSTGRLFSASISVNLLFDLCCSTIYYRAVCRKFSIGSQLPLSFPKAFSPAFVRIPAPRSAAEGRGRAAEEGKEFVCFGGREVHSSLLSPAAA